MYGLYTITYRLHLMLSDVEYHQIKAGDWWDNERPIVHPFWIYWIILGRWLIGLEAIQVASMTIDPLVTVLLGFRHFSHIFSVEVDFCTK